MRRLSLHSLLNCSNTTVSIQYSLCFISIKFAANIGIDFYTPEEFFLKEKPAPFDWPTFMPKNLDPNGPLLSPVTAKLKSERQELIIMVGYPASGKTTFVNEHLMPHGYLHINRDSLGSWQKCVSACKDALSRAKSVVIDNTSPTAEVRKRYVDCAKQAKIPARCFVFNVSYEHALHNNKASLACISNSAFSLKPPRSY